MDGHDPGLGQAEAGGRLDVISLGPGDEFQLTPECRRALAEADLLAGHKLYLELVPQELRASAELAPSGMGREVERVKAALGRGPDRPQGRPGMFRRRRGLRPGRAGFWKRSGPGRSESPTTGRPIRAN